MSDLSVRTVTLGEMRAGPPAGLADPHGLLEMHPAKRAALLANPLARGDGDPARLIGLSGNTVIGRVELFAGEIALDGAPQPIVWGSALTVPEEHRATGIGLMLILAMQSAGPAVGACGISQVVKPIYRKLRWTCFELPRHVLVRRSRAFLASYLPAAFPAGLAAPFADAAFAAQRALVARRAAAVRRRVTVEAVERLPDDLADDIADAMTARDGAAPHRSPAWVNWLAAHDFDALPSRRKRLCLVRDRKDGTPLGHFLVKARFFERATQRAVRDVTIGSVQDWISLDPDRLSDADLVWLAIEATLALDVDAVEICTDDAKVQAALAGAKIPVMGALDFVFRAAPKTPLADPAWRDQDRWRLRPAESDNFFT